MAHLSFIILTLFGALASSSGDVQEAAPYKPSGWRPAGPPFLLPPRGEANTVSFSSTPLSPPPPPPVPSSNRFTSSSRPLSSSPPTFSRPNPTLLASSRFPDPGTFAARETTDERTNTLSFINTPLSPPPPPPVPSNNQFSTSFGPQLPPSLAPSRPNPSLAGSRFPDPGTIPVHETTGERTDTLSFTNTPLSPPPPPPVPSNNQFSTSFRPQLSPSPTPSRPSLFPPSHKFPDSRTFPNNEATDELPNTPTRQFNSNVGISTQNVFSTSSVGQFPEDRRTPFSDTTFSNYPGDRDDHRSPSTNLNDDQSFPGKSQLPLRPAQTFGQPDDLPQEFPPSRDFVRQYLPPNNEQADPSSSFVNAPGDERPGGLSQYATPSLPDDDYQTSPAEVDSSSTSNSDSSYRPVQEYGVPLPSLETSTQQKTPRVYFVVLPIRPPKQPAPIEKAPVFSLAEDTTNVRVENRNSQASQRASPRRRHV